MTEIARITGLHRGAIRRLLHTLVQLGYVQSDGKNYTLRPRILELGYSYMASLSFPEIARVHLERLAAEVDESVSMAVPDGAEIVYVGRITVRRTLTVDITIGSRWPAHETSIGRLFLADLAEPDLRASIADVEFHPRTGRSVRTLDDLRAIIDKVRADGYSVMDEETEAAVRSIAVPVRNHRKQVVAGINVAIRDAGPRRSLEEFLPALRRAGEEIEHDIAASVTMKAKSPR
ncbi:helix-turn-helix domain-containing protein [Pseudonocardia kujensis]|nr:helix-turn-helix domain-containing protein [Pseudonocardia kujensis]